MSLFRRLHRRLDYYFLAAVALFLLWFFWGRQLPSLAVKNTLAEGLIAIAIAAAVLLWRGPKWSNNKFVKKSDREKLEDERRRTLAQVLGGFAILIGVYSTFETMKIAEQNLTVTQNNEKLAKETLEVGQETLKTDRDKLDIDRDRYIGERYALAIGQLADPKMSIRLGGLHALERVALDSERDRVAIIKVLASILRQESPRVHQDPPFPKPDIMAMIAVIGRLTQKGAVPRLDLRSTSLRGGDLAGSRLSLADFVGTDFFGADLSKAYFTGANLRDATLAHADLSGADLRKATLRDTSFDNAVLIGARFGGNLFVVEFTSVSAMQVDLRDSVLHDANFGKADLRKAKLRGAKLRYTSFREADLRGADLSELESLSGTLSFGMANLQGVDLRTLTKFFGEYYEFGGSCMDKTTRLPRGFHPPESLSAECQQYWRGRPVGRPPMIRRERLSP